MSIQICQYCGNAIADHYAVQTATGNQLYHGTYAECEQFVKSAKR